MQPALLLTARSQHTRWHTQQAIAIQPQKLAADELESCFSLKQKAVAASEFWCMQMQCLNELESTIMENLAFNRLFLFDDWQSLSRMERKQLSELSSLRGSSMILDEEASSYHIFSYIWFFVLLFAKSVRHENCELVVRPRSARNSVCIRRCWIDGRTVRLAHQSPEKNTQLIGVFHFFNFFNIQFKILSNNQHPDGHSSSFESDAASAISHLKDCLYTHQKVKSQFGNAQALTANFAVSWKIELNGI